MSARHRTAKPIVAILMSDEAKLSWTDRSHLLSDGLIEELSVEFDLRYKPEYDPSDPAVAAELLDTKRSWKVDGPDTVIEAEWSYAREGDRRPLLLQSAGCSRQFRRGELESGS